MPGQAACARRPVSSRTRGRSVSGEPNGLTGEHVCQSGPHPTDGPLWPVRRAAWTGRGVVERRRPERDGGAGSGAGDACRCGRCRHFVSRLLIQAITRPVVDKRFTGAGSSRITVRSTEAPAEGDAQQRLAADPRCRTPSRGRRRNGDTRSATRDGAKAAVDPPFTRRGRDDRDPLYSLLIKAPKDSWFDYGLVSVKGSALGSDLRRPPPARQRCRESRRIGLCRKRHRRHHVKSRLLGRGNRPACYGSNC